MSETGNSIPAQAEEKQPRDSVVRDVIILVMITLAAGLLLGAAYSVTKGPIASAQARAKAQAQQAVMERAASFEPLDGAPDMDALSDSLEEKGLTHTTVEQVDAAKDGAGETSGYVVTCSNTEGYGGEIRMMCGITPSGDGSLTIEGISFLALTETAGMGMRAKEEAFTGQFTGKTIAPGQMLVYTKNGAAAGNEIDAISGCTITTEAVTKDVNAALEAVRSILQ